MKKLEKDNKRKEELKLFRKRIKKLFEKKYRYSMRYENNVVMDDGKAYINVDLTKVESPFSVFSYERRFNQEIFDYIDNEVFYLRAEIPVVINFDDGGKYSEELKDKIRKVVIRHYSLIYEDKRLEHSKNIFTGILLSIIGAILLGIFVTLCALTDINPVFLEIFEIVSWVFIWTATDKFLFSGHDKRIDIYNAGQLALCEVTFGKPVNKI